MLSSNFREFERAIEDAARRIETGLDNALDTGAQIALDQKQTELDETYNRPERKLKSGKPAYQRSGNLRKQQTIQRGAGTRDVGTVGSATAYEGRLAKLPTGPDGVNRSNDAAGRVPEKIEGRVFEAAAREIEKALT